MQTLFEAATSKNDRSIIDRVKTFDDACRELGLSTVQVGVVGLDDDAVSIAAYMKLIIIIRALNEGWVPDWSDNDEYKYFPWFEHESGFGLSFLVYDDWTAFTGVGSRLCFKTRELAEYAAKQFRDIYNDYLSIK